MPRIELIPEVYYQPDDPYHWEIDNLPLKNIITRQNLINLSLDNVLNQIRNAAGSAGTMANRLNQSINENGSLKTEAIDTALHSIEEHTDGSNYVRMTSAQSDKLNLISDEANYLSITVNSDGSSDVELTSGTVAIKPSTTVVPVIESPNILKFNLAFDSSMAHRHYYGSTPVHANLSSPDYINYKVNSTSSEYVDGSLRVYINGTRIFEDDEVYAPGYLVTDPFTLLSFNSDSTSGTFELSSAITEDDVIKIDYDISLT